MPAGEFERTTSARCVACHWSLVTHFGLRTSDCLPSQRFSGTGSVLRSSPIPEHYRPYFSSPAAIASFVCSIADLVAVIAACVCMPVAFDSVM